MCVCVLYIYVSFLKSWNDGIASFYASTVFLWFWRVQETASFLCFPWSYLISLTFVLFFWLFVVCVREMDTYLFSKSVNYLSPTSVIVCNGVFSIICRRTETFFSSMLKHGHNKNQKPFLISSLNFLSPAFLWEEDRYFIFQTIEAIT